VVQLNGEVKYTEAGKVYYQFPTADSLEATQGKKYQKLIRSMEHLINYKDQVVTVTDLVLKTELSPQECQNFLDKFVVQLNGEVNYTEAGKVYYQFPTMKNLELKKLVEKS
jgi:ribosomal protein S30